MDNTEGLVAGLITGLSAVVLIALLRRRKPAQRPEDMAKRHLPRALRGKVLQFPAHA